jgi:carbon storage regulator CsrA
VLVLSRRVGEAIIVDGHIHITVVEVLGDKVRLGIVAPREVVVDRQEVHEKRQNPLNDWVQRGAPDRPWPPAMN